MKQINPTTAALIGCLVMLIGLYPSASYSKKSGEKELDEVRRLNNECMDAYAKGNYASGIETCQKALDTCEKNLGPDDPFMAVCLNNLSLMYKSMGDYSKSEQLYKRSLEMCEKVLGPEHPVTATTLDNLAALYSNMGDYSRAEPLHKRSLEIREKVLGPEHQDTATSLNNLATLYYSMGDYSRAESFFKRALEINEKVLGPEHPKIAATLDNLAVLYLHMGDYSMAEPLYKRALEINEKILGPEHPNTARTLNNLAEFYRAMSDYSRAEPLYKRALEINKKVLGPEHPETANSLNNLAVLYDDMGDYSKAEPLHKQALEIREKVLGPEHSDTAGSLNNLALLYFYMGDYSKADPLYKRALEIQEKVLGPEHPDTAISLNNLAFLYDSMGDYSKAEPLYERALGINEKMLGPEHPDTAVSLNNLAGLYYLTGKPNQAAPLMEKGFHAELKNAENIFSFASERERLEYQAKILDSMSGFLSLALDPASDDSFKRSADDAVVRSKGIVLESLVGEREAVLAGMDPGLKETYEELKNVRSQISALYVKGPGNNADDYRKRLADLDRRSEELESKLARGSAEYRAERERDRAGFAEVCQVVPAGTALVDYVYFDRLEKKDQPGEPKWTPWMAAFVVKGGDCGTPALIDLGPADKIEAAVKGWREPLMAVIRGETDLDEKNKSDLMARGRELAHLAWDPVVTKLSADAKITIAPDGPLHLVSFAALPDEQGKYLIETHDLDYVTVAKDFLPKSGGKERTGQALIVGNPDFDLSRKTLFARNGDKDVTRGSRGDCALLQNLRYDPLPAAEREAQEITALFKDNGRKARQIKGKDATEELFKSAAADAPILHLATHGFFLAGDCAAAEEGRGVKRRGGSLDPSGGRMSSMVDAPSSQMTVNPLLLSGLALAGANNSDKYSGEDDGTLLALEIANLDLRGVKLVVLSACDTGLGEVKRGEGVFGLKRSFIMAGADGLVVSLWSVPDQPTQELMKLLYSKVLQGQEPGEALRSSQLEMIATARSSGGSDHPLLWAAFQYVK